MFAACDLVLEAVVEEMPAKKEVFAELERVVSAECVLATNTSSLSVTQMGAGLEHPERVVGMHFFNPVAVLPLVELASHTVDRRHFARDRLGSDQEAPQDGRPRSRRARLRRQPTPRSSGVRRDAGARPRQHRRGDGRGSSPHGAADGTVRPPAARRPEGGEPRPAHAARRVARSLSAFEDPREPRRGWRPGDRRDAPRTVDELHTAVLEALADESRHILEEGVVAEAADIDTCLILGAGFPFWLGGITKHLDQTGVSQRVVGSPAGRARRRNHLEPPLSPRPESEVCSVSTARRSTGERNSSEGAARNDVLPECTRRRPSRR